MITGENGAFRAPALPVGRYSVRVELTGFQTQTQRGLILESGAGTGRESDTGSWGRAPGGSYGQQRSAAGQYHEELPGRAGGGFEYGPVVT
jgi:hypothetical protein